MEALVQHLTLLLCKSVDFLLYFMTFCSAVHVHLYVLILEDINFCYFPRYLSFVNLLVSLDEYVVEWRHL